MGHNSVISGHPKSTGIPGVDWLSMGPPDLGRHIIICLYVDDMHIFETNL